MMQRTLDDFLRLIFHSKVTAVSGTKIEVNPFGANHNERVRHEWIDGISLREIFEDDLLRSKSLEEFDLLLSCVEKLHRTWPTILHGDISPGNIIRHVDRDNRVEYKLIDWSEYSLSLYEAAVRRRRHFRAKPAYLSSRRAITGVNSIESEIYALGAILFEWTTGRSLLPHKISQSLNLDLWEHLNQKILLAPAWCQSVLERSLISERSDVFRSVSEFRLVFAAAFLDVENSRKNSLKLGTSTSRML